MNVWTEQRIEHAKAVLADCSPLNLRPALDRLTEDFGFPITGDALGNAFRKRGLGSPSLYCKAGPRPFVPPMPLQVAAKLAPEKPAQDFSRLFELVKKGLPFADLCDALDLAPSKARALVEQAQGAGYHIAVDASGQVAYKPPQPSDEKREVVPPVVGERQRVAVISDLHFGSKYCLRAQMADFIDHAYRQGVRTVLCPGDVLDGIYRHGRWELTHHGLEEQAEDALRSLPQRPGLSYAAISGNHDQTFTDTCGVDVGRYLQDYFEARGRRDLKFYGARGAHLQVHGAHVHLWHPLKGVGYARSYPLQKQIERYAPGEKPQILLTGHWHVFSYIFERGVHAVACPTFQGGGSAFGKALGGAPAIGGLILSWGLTETGTMRDFVLEHRSYFEGETRHVVDPMPLSP